MTRIIFMGTPEFAVPSLRALVAYGAAERAGGAAGDGGPVGVVTRPDKPSGRGRGVAYSPVKQFALDAGLPVYQPGPLRRPEALDLLRSLTPDLIVVAAFGQILPPDVLALPPHGCLNVHASLLPRYRGASPITAAILAGEAETGVTIMRMDEGLDTGPTLARRALAIAPDDTTASLTARLATLGADLLVETLPRWLRGELTPEPQDAALATMTRPLRKEDGRIDWRQPAERIARQVRACVPWPTAYTTWNGKQLKVLQARPLAGAFDAAPGVTFHITGAAGRRMLACASGQGALALDVIQLEGKRALPAEEVTRGYPALIGAQLGP